MTMAREKTPGGLGMLLLSLLDQQDRYGYEMIEALRQRSNQVFDLKAGTLYPLLHTLEAQGWVTSYDGGTVDGRVRRYYHLTDSGKDALETQKTQWKRYADGINGVLEGGVSCGV